MHRFYWLVFLFFFAKSDNSFAVLIADIESVSFFHTVQRKDLCIYTEEDFIEDPLSDKLPEEDLHLSSFLRIIFFDTESQEFVDHSGKNIGNAYYISAVRDQPYSSQPFPFPGWFTIKSNFDGTNPILNIDFSPFQQTDEVKIIRFQQTDEIKRTFYNSSSIIIENPIIIDETRSNLKCLTTTEVREFPSSQYPTIESIQSFLSKNENRRKKSKVSLNEEHNIFDHRDSKWKVVILDIKNIDEQKKIGELAADITMQWLGFSKKDGKYKKSGSDSGFDGIYVRGDYLIISESKFYNINPPKPSNIIKDLYSKMNNRFNNISIHGSPIQKITLQQIKDHLRTPINVLLLGYVVINSGNIKSLAKKCEDIEKEINPIKQPISSSSISYESSSSNTVPENEQIEFFRSFITQKSLSPENALSLFLKALNITPEQAIEMLQAIQDISRLEQTIKKDPQENSHGTQIPSVIISEDVSSVSSPDNVEQYHQNSVNVSYNKKNLGKLLSFLKERHSWKQIKDDIKGKSSQLGMQLNESYTLAPNLSKLSRPTQYPKALVGIDHNNFWELLKQTYPFQFNECFSSQK